jgi:hypothetical protein
MGNWELVYIAVLKKVRYALCPMPYALCPMPYAHEYLIFLRKAIDILSRVLNVVQARSPGLATRA